MNEDEALASLAAISNPARLRMLRALVAAGPSGLTAGGLAEEIGATPSRASFHLSNLSAAGLVTFERSAQRITYRVDFDAMGGLIRYLIDDCCGRDATVVACCLPSVGTDTRR